MNTANYEEHIRIIEVIQPNASQMSTLLKFYATSAISIALLAIVTETYNLFIVASIFPLLMFTSYRGSPYQNQYIKELISEVEEIYNTSNKIKKSIKLMDETENLAEFDTTVESIITILTTLI